MPKTISDTTHLIGQLTVTSGAQPSVVDETVAALINERIQPPAPVAVDDIHVRSLRLISDEVNDHGGRFPSDEHERLCNLIIDSPVLIGHDRSQLPLARNFAARTIHDDSHQWIQVWFYWMRGVEGDRLAAEIDGGIVKEGSIGFEFQTPRCSICGLDIRRCEHVPGERYTSVAGETLAAHYEYRDIVRVLETSLVYRGATPGTRLGNEAVFSKLHSPARLRRNSTNIGRLFGLIIERKDEDSPVMTYLAARRSPSDASVCDEFTITTNGRFQVGDLIALNHGCWNRMPVGVSLRTLRRALSNCFQCGHPQ